jgi:hypothetical protein
MPSQQRAAVILSLAAAAAATNANPTVYESRAAFDLAVGPQTIETFENSAPGDLALPHVFASGLQVARPVGAVDVYVGFQDQYGFVNTTNPGRNYLAFGRDVPGTPGQTGSYSAEFTLGGPQRAFGFDISGFEPLLGAQGFNVTTYSNGQIAEDFFVPVGDFEPVRFFGMVFDTGFDTIRINLPVIGFDGEADYVAFDDVVWAVPTPASLALLGLGGVCAARRRW